MKNSYCRILLPLSFYFFSFFLSSCEWNISYDDPSQSGSSDGKTGIVPSWTIMVYMAADNNLEPYALLDLNEMEAGITDNAGVNLLALVDRSPLNYTLPFGSGAVTSEGNWSGTRCYLVKHDSNTGLVTSPQIELSALGLESGVTSENMGDPATLRAFIDFGLERYPADNTMLVLWDHGGGWRALPVSGSRELCQDDTNGYDVLYTQELGVALSGLYLSVIGFDLCQEAGIEAVYEIRNSGKYMVASETDTPLAGWNYADFLTRFISGKRLPETLLDAAVASFEAAYGGGTSDPVTFPVNIAALDLGLIGDVNDALNGLSESLSAVMDTAEKRTALRTLIQENVYTTVPDSYEISLDLYDLADQLSELSDYADDAAGTLKEALSETVVAEWHDPLKASGAYGISVHFIQFDSTYTAALDFDPAYKRGYSGAYPLAFVGASSWVPDIVNGKGLLYRLWYEDGIISP